MWCARSCVCAVACRYVLLVASQTSFPAGRCVATEASLKGPGFCYTPQADQPRRDEQWRLQLSCPPAVPAGLCSGTDLRTGRFRSQLPTHRLVYLSIYGHPASVSYVFRLGSASWGPWSPSPPSLIFVLFSFSRPIYGRTRHGRLRPTIGSPKRDMLWAEDRGTTVNRTEITPASAPAGTQISGFPWPRGQSYDRVSRSAHVHMCAATLLFA